MPALQTFQARAFGPVASTIALANRGGAVLGGIWISAKGAAGKITVYDNSASTTASIRIPVTSVGAVGAWMHGNPINMGAGLAVKVLSCTGAIFWRPAT